MWRPGQPEIVRNFGLTHSRCPGRRGGACRALALGLLAQDIGDLRIDPVRREVTVGDDPVHLTVREYDLLLHLAQNADRPFTRSQLLEQIWGITYEGYDRTIDSHVQRLRAKIEPDSGDPTYVKTVWGVGYKLASDG